MKHGLFDSDARPQFTGHETFPLRILWLKKAYEAVKGGAPAGLFQEPSAIVRFGVGRNMAASMRYWSLASGFVEEVDRILKPTALGVALLDDNGVDPCLEQAGTIWLAHWATSSTPKYSGTTYYAFNGLSALEFDTSTIANELFFEAEERGWRVTRGTLKRDAEVFVRGYIRRTGGVVEDAAEPLFAELGLVRETRGGWCEFVRGPKPSLPDEIFAYALNAFWERTGQQTTLTAEQVCYAPGSPGRVFKLDEDSVITRLMGLEDLTDGAMLWTDTAGLRQVQRRGNIDPVALVIQAYNAWPAVAV